MYGNMNMNKIANGLNFFVIKIIPNCRKIMLTAKKTGDIKPLEIGININKMKAANNLVKIKLKFSILIFNIMLLKPFPHYDYRIEF